MRKITLLTGIAVSFLLLAYFVSIIERWDEGNPERLYQEQLVIRGKMGSVRTPALKSVPVDYDARVAHMIRRALSTTIVVASWYGGNDGFVGKCKANGDFYDDRKFTVAHKTLPLGTIVALERDGRYALAKVTDRGPYIPGRDLDLSRALAERLSVGVDRVTLHVLRIPKEHETYHKVNRACLKT